MLDYEIDGSGLVITPKSDSRLKECMEKHYSAPKGFVGRSLCYAIMLDGKYLGHIVGGSSVLHLRQRDLALEIRREDGELNQVINNVFFHIEPPAGGYPYRNFVASVIREWMFRTCIDWDNKYSENIIGFETLVEPPRTGDCYERTGWEMVGWTKGFTCKRVAGKKTDKWTGKRVWDTENLRPKQIFVYYPYYYDECHWYNVANGDMGWGGKKLISVPKELFK